MNAQQLSPSVPAKRPNLKPNGKKITIRWEKDSKFPTIRGQWKRLKDGRIEATYTADELEQCRKTYESIHGSD